MALTKIGKEGITGIDNSSNATAITIDSSENVAMAGTLDVTGDLTVDTSTLKVDSSNNRVGINTTSSVRDLQIGDNSRSASVLSLQTNSSGNGSIYFGDNTTTNAEYGGMIRYSHSDNAMQFWTSSTESARIDSSGNVGIGVVPSNWTDFSSLDIKGASFAGLSPQGAFVFSNVYYDGSYRYQTSSVPASYYSTGSGTHKWFIAPSGTADNVISSTQAATIDASGNLLVGTTDTNVLANRGFAAKPQGSNNVRVDIGSNYQAMLLSTQNDGDIVGFYKDSTGVGSIGVYTDRIYLSTANRGIALDESGANLLPVNGTGINNDATLNLGASSVRWQDLYLSGGVYLGGTGSSNLLNDYEEGTWSPTLIGSTSGEASYNARDGHYIKVGEMVTIFFHMTCSSVTALSGNVEVGNLPFNVSNALAGTGVQAGCAVGFFTGLSSTVSFMSATPQGNTSRVPIRVIGGTGTTAITTLTPSYLSNNFGFRFTCSYIAA